MSNIDAENIEDRPEEKDSLLQWALDVQAVWKYLGKAAGRRALGSSAAKELHDMTADPDFKTKFVTQLVPKSVEILAKYKQTDVPDALLQAEKRPIAELQAILQQALSEATQ